MIPFWRVTLSDLNPKKSQVSKMQEKMQILKMTL